MHYWSILTAYYDAHLQIENPYKRTVYNAEDVAMGTKFSFAADVDGEYKMCFTDNVRMNAYGTRLEWCYLASTMLQPTF